MASLPELLRSLVNTGTTLDREQARECLAAMLAGEAGEAESAALLTTMATRGETHLELAGFVDYMRATAVELPLTEGERAELVDNCGTGGGGPATFNVSTGAALVAAAAGARVAKHGNRAVTSQCGSADVIEALGVPVLGDPVLAAACLRETGFVFLFAPAFHPVMARLLPLRRALGFRTILNLCGPLASPVRVRRQVIGVLSPARTLLFGRTLALLGTDLAFVVHGTDGLDELTLTGESIVVRVEAPQPVEEPIGAPGKPLRASRVVPEMAGLPRAALADLAGGTAAENAAILYDLLAGTPGPCRDIVLLNAAAVLVAGGVTGDLRDGVERAGEAIDSGRAAALLARLREFGRRFAERS